MRHGEVAYYDDTGSPLGIDPSLSPAGREQARVAGAALAGMRFDRLITSDLVRTIETARIVAPELDPVVVPELAELRGGRLDEIPGDELELAFTGAFRNEPPETTRFLRGESIGEFLDRVLPVIDALVDDPGWRDALAVLHGAVNRAIISTALAGRRAYFGSFEQGPACINILDHGPDRWIVRTVNYTPYNPLHTGTRATSVERLLAQYRPPGED